MHAWARASLFLALGFWLACVVIACVAIYGFDSFENAWGRGPSLQVDVWLATGFSICVLIGAVAGFRVGARDGSVPRNLVSLLLGPIAVLGLFIAPLIDSTQNLFGRILLIVTPAAVSALIAYVSTRIVSDAASHRVGADRERSAPRACRDILRPRRAGALRVRRLNAGVRAHEGNRVRHSGGNCGATNCFSIDIYLAIGDSRC